MWERLGPEGFMVITALDGNDTGDLKDWADTYGSTHPVVGDGDGTFFWTYSKTCSWPMKVLVDHGMVLTSVDDMAEESDVQALLDQYQ